MENEDYSLASYDYDLPEHLIASYPPQNRGDSRLLIIDKKMEENFGTDLFKNIQRYLPKNALLVLNNTSVLPARLFAKKASGGKAQFLLLTPLPLLEIKEEKGYSQAVAEGLVRPVARVKCGEWLEVTPELKFLIIEKHDFGRVTTLLRWQGDLEKIIRQNGKLPLPPYLKRPAESCDEKRYQTVYASRTGAVAAPTAGLHFTEEHINSLKMAGITFVETTLHVGYGTFTPVRNEDIRRHQIHSEYMEISEAAANELKEARAQGRPIIAVGTTSLRALEGMLEAWGTIRPFSGWTNIFIYPDKEITLADGLITNFHLPRSSLLMLVSAFAGRKRILTAYKQAIGEGFRFFSYGDAMLILR